MTGAARGREDWLPRVRSGLVAFLGFFDDHPVWGRLLLDQNAADRAGELALRREGRLVGVLTTLLDDGSPPVLGEVMAEPRLVSELVAGGVLAVLRRRLLMTNEGERFVSLAPELLAFAVAPYLGEAAAREQLHELAPRPIRARAELHAEGRPIDLPIRITHRTTLVLRAIATTPGLSNRDLAQTAGPIDAGQLSKLLMRLAQRGLIENRAQNTPFRWPNAWHLTRAGERVVGLLDASAVSPPRRKRSSHS